MMTRYILLLLFCAGLKYSQAQNLVPNSSFEEVVDCSYPDLFDAGGTGLSEMDYISQWYPVAIEQDFQPLWFHPCVDSSAMESWGSISMGITGNTGDGFSQIVVYRLTDTYINIGEYQRTGRRTFLQARLSRSLSKGDQIYISFHCRPHIYEFGDEAYCNSVGIAFSDTLIQMRFDDDIRAPNIPVALEHRGDLLDDFSQWKHIHGVYQSKGWEQYIVVGNFLGPEELECDWSRDTMAQPVARINLFIDDIEVHVFNPLPDTLLLCDGEELELEGRFLDGRAIWSNGSQDSVITVSTPGTYMLEVQIDTVSLFDTVVVISAEQPVSSLIIDTMICQDQVYLWTENLYGNYFWSDGYQEKERDFLFSGDYSLTVENTCTEYYREFNVQIMDCDCQVFVPSAFSPDGNGINDEMELFINCDYPFEIKNMAVFDRWGNQVYSSSQASQFWDGTYNGQEMENGVYVWVLEYIVHTGTGSEPKVKTGDITLLR